MMNRANEDDDNKPNVLSRLSGTAIGAITGLIGGGITEFLSTAWKTTALGVVGAGSLGFTLGKGIGFIVGMPIGAIGGLLFGLGEALFKFDTSNILKRMIAGTETAMLAVGGVGGLAVGISSGIAGGALGIAIGLPVGAIGAVYVGIKTGLSRAELGFTQGLMAALKNKPTTTKRFYGGLNAPDLLELVPHRKKTGGSSPTKLLSRPSDGVVDRSPKNDAGFTSQSQSQPGSRRSLYKTSLPSKKPLPAPSGSDTLNEAPRGKPHKR